MASFYKNTEVQKINSKNLQFLGIDCQLQVAAYS